MEIDKEKELHDLLMDKIKGRMVERNAGFSTGHGWDGILIALDTELNEIFPDYTLVQVKEKFGGLRYYITGCPSEIWDQVYAIIRKYEQMSYDTCENCAAPSVASEERESWLQTLCAACRTAKKKARKGDYGWMKAHNL